MLCFIFLSVCFFYCRNSYMHLSFLSYSFFFFVSVIKVITGNFQIEHIFQGLTRAQLKSQDSDPIQTGLLCDPRSRSLVLNGRPGHLQFYSVQEDKHLYNVSRQIAHLMYPKKLCKICYIKI